MPRHREGDRDGRVEVGAAERAKRVDEDEDHAAEGRRHEPGGLAGQEGRAPHEQQEEGSQGLGGLRAQVTAHASAKACA
jgi:hypothetical protein